MNMVEPRPIKEYALGIYDGPHATPKESLDGPIFLGIKNITENGQLSFSEIRHVSEAEFPKWTRRVTPQAGDVVFTYEATLHRYALIPEGFCGCLGRRVALIRPDPKQADGRFLLYFFLSHGWMKVVESFIITGATVDRIPLEKFPDSPAAIPILPIQKKIADVLSTYDDLIENNRRRMALLEESARQLYREWFVRLRFPGHEHTRITNGVPQGWERKPIAALTLFLKRGITPHYDEDAEGLVINQKCVRNGRLDVTLARRQSREFKPDQQVQRGDVLVNSTGQGTLGRLAQVLAAIPNCTVDTHVTILRPRQTAGTHYFGLAVMDWEPRFSTMGRGATNQTELSPGQIGAAEVLLPSHSLIQQFEEYTSPIFSQVITRTDQNINLRAAHDLLLRLMSGVISV